MRRSKRAFVIALLLAGCGPAVPVASRPPLPSPARAPEEPLEYVPAAGLRWLVHCRPAQILADRELSPALGQLVDPERLAAFTRLTGVDPRELVSVAIAGYDLGTLYVATLPKADGGLARARFTERLSSGAVVKHPRPNIFRIAGTRAGSARALVAIDDRILALATDDLTLSRIAQAYAERRLKSPTALHGAALAPLPPPASDALAVFYAPGPFAGPWRQAARGLFGTAVGVEVVMGRSKAGSIPVTISVAGDWEDRDLEAELGAAWTEVATSSTGRLFGLEQAKNIKSVAHLHMLTWSADLALAPLVAGLRAATVANVPEMFDVQAAEPAGSPAEPLPAN